jgi:hypothetical protein
MGLQGDIVNPDIYEMAIRIVASPLHWKPIATFTTFVLRLPATNLASSADGA